MIDPNDVCACLVTRGDIDMQPILDSLPYGEVVVWDNSVEAILGHPDALVHGGGGDWGVYGRYLAMKMTDKPIIYTQDDDCIVTCHDELMAAYEPGVVVGNMLNNDPARLEYYRDTTLLGWGAIFDADLPWRAFRSYALYYPTDPEFKTSLGMETVFPMLSRTKTIIEGIEWLDQDGPVLERSNRMWKQPDFYTQRDFWMARAREVRERLRTENWG